MTTINNRFWLLPLLGLSLMVNVGFAQATEQLINDSASGGIIMQSTVLRSAPKDSARQQAELWQGQWVEIRGRKQDYLQVYDYQRERGGFVKASAIRPTKFEATEAPELLAVMRYLRDTDGSDSLGISLATAYVKAAAATDVNSAQGAEVLDAIGIFADRLAKRASSETALSKTAASRLAQQLEVAKQLGINFKQIMRDEQMLMCYNGEVYRQVLALPASPETKAHAALALTEETCINPAMTPLERAQLDVWRAEVIGYADTRDLASYLKNRVEMRRASILSALSYARTRFDSQPESLKNSGINDSARQLMDQALTAFARVQKNELAESDLGEYNNAAMRVNANRWAAVANDKVINGELKLQFNSGEPGETCVSLINNKQKETLIKRCTYSLVWAKSVSINREKNAIALAVQPTAGWRELWVFRKSDNGWQIHVLPPALREVALGYAEFAGWIPGGKQILVAKESRSENVYDRKYEVIDMDSLTTQRQASNASMLGAFQRWQDKNWKAQSVAMR